MPSVRAIVICGLLIFCGCATVRAQLTLVAGFPEVNFIGPPHFATDLVHLDKNGKIAARERLFEENVATQWLTISYDSGIFVALSETYSKVLPRKLVVRSIVDNRTIQTCKLDGEFLGTVPLYQFLAVEGSGGAMFLEIGVARTPHTHAEDLRRPNPASLRSIRLGSGQTCDVYQREWSALAHTVHHGYSGVFGDGIFDGIRYYVDDQGKARLPVAAVHIDSDVNISPEVLGGKLQHLVVLCNDKVSRVVSVAAEPGSGCFLQRKRDGTWHRLSYCNVEFGSPIIRTFGRYLAIVERFERGGSVRSSSGTEKIRELYSENGMSRVELLASTKKLYPGILHVLDTDTWTDYRITTGLADSEIVLVANHVVYYRANDQLYRAALSQGTVGKPELILTDPVVADVHWAYLRP